MTALRLLASRMAKSLVPDPTAIPRIRDADAEAYAVLQGLEADPLAPRMSANLYCELSNAIAKRIEDATPYRPGISRPPLPPAMWAALITAWAGEKPEPGFRRLTKDWQSTARRHAKAVVHDHVLRLEDDPTYELQLQQDLGRLSFRTGRLYIALLMAHIGRVSARTHRRSDPEGYTRAQQNWRDCWEAASNVGSYAS